jgi:hypothetical protein
VQAGIDAGLAETPIRFREVSGVAVSVATVLHETFATPAIISGLHAIALVSAACTPVTSVTPRCNEVSNDSSAMIAPGEFVWIDRVQPDRTLPADAK